MVLKTKRYRVQVFGSKNDVIAISFAPGKPGIRSGDCYLRAIKAETDPKRHIANQCLPPNTPFLAAESIDEIRDRVSASAVGSGIKRCLGIELQDIKAKSDRYIDFDLPVSVL